jgi:hypothetical protein
MNKFQRSWLLFKSSLTVMMQNKTLLVFPIVSFVCTVLIVLFFLMPVAFQPTGHSITTAQHWERVYHSAVQSTGNSVADEDTGLTSPKEELRLQPKAWAYLVALYFVCMFVATFFNVACYSQIMGALKGQSVSLSAGLQFAATKWKAILFWTMFAGAVGYIIKSLEERFGLIGRLVMRLVGTAWSVASIFVIPVLVTEQETDNPLAMLKKSALTLKQTWGETLIGYVGVNFGGLILLIISIVYLGAGVLLSVLLNTGWIIGIMAFVWLISVLLLAYLMGVASQIFRCALFVYATHGSIPEPYTPALLSKII